MNIKSSFSSINEVLHPKTQVFDEILKKCKSHRDKRGLGYINWTGTPTSGDTVFVKGKKEPLAKQHLLGVPYFAYIVRSLEILKIDATLDFLRGMSLN